MTAWTDRGWRLDFAPPRGSRPTPQLARLQRQPVEGGRSQALWDIESASFDPAGGQTWLGIEYAHAVQRLDARGRPDGVRVLPRSLGWPENAGLESLTRLPDGRFVGIAEWAGEALLFAGDPVEGAEFSRVPIVWPRADYAATDAAVLPDGRLLVLLRHLELAVPQSFASLLVAGPMPQAGEAWRPRVLLDLTRVLPPENYEGMALHPLPGGGAEIWLIADDNASAFQRTLLAKLIYRPNERAREAVPRAPRMSSD